MASIISLDFEMKVLLMDKEKNSIIALVFFGLIFSLAMLTINLNHIIPHAN